MVRAIELLKNNFGVSQTYKHDVVKNDEIILTVYWHPLTIAERELIQKKSTSEDTNEFALQLMIAKALDEDGNKLFQDGDRTITADKLRAFLHILVKSVQNSSDDGVDITSVTNARSLPQSRGTAGTLYNDGDTVKVA